MVQLNNAYVAQFVNHYVHSIQIINGRPDCFCVYCNDGIDFYIWLNEDNKWESDFLSFDAEENDEFRPMFLNRNNIIFFTLKCFL